MKKIIIIILFLSLMLTICSCNNLDNRENLSDLFESSEDGEPPLLTIELTLEYRKLLKSGKLPANFVSYDKIKQLGEFVSVVFLSDAQNGDYSSYMYTLVDSTGYEVALYIDAIKEQDELYTTSSISRVNNSNMRLLGEEISGIYNYNGFVYKYVSGKLLSISWVDEDITYKLCGDPMLSNYPTTNTTFVGKILNLNNATKAFEEVFDLASE